MKKNNREKLAKPLTVTIGIPTLNSENNIIPLIKSVLIQNQDGFYIEKIIVYSDGSIDSTVRNARTVKDKRIQVIESTERKGFGYGLKIIMDMNKSDYLITLNDDIVIYDDNLINKLFKYFREDHNVGFVTGNPQSLMPRTFIEKALVSRLTASERLSNYIKNGNNNFSCDGKCMMFSKGFIRKIIFPKQLKLLGNVDAYMYFSCITNGLTYYFAKDAKVYFHNASTFADYTKWIGRNNLNRNILIRQFGDVVAHEYKKPLIPFLCTSTIEFIKNPIGGLYIIFAELYIKFKSKQTQKNFSEKWEMILSSKIKL